MDYLLNDMLTIADEKLLKMTELLELTKDQTELLEEENVEILERFIGYRQSIMERIDTLDARFKELRMRFLTAADVRNLEEIEANHTVRTILELGAKTKDVLKAMIEIDNHNINMGKQLLEKLGSKLKYAGKASLARKEYQRESSGAIFINRQG